MVVPIVAHHCQVYPLQGHLSDLSNQIWTRPYLLIQWVVSSITSVEIEASILLRDLVSHGTFKGMAVDQRHSELLGVVGGMVTSKLLDEATPMSISFIGSKGIPYATHPCQQTHIPPIHDHDISHHNNTPMIHASFLFPCIQSFMFHICMSFSSSPRLMWPANSALVTLVYPNWMQYTPCVLQEASLLDGVDAGVHRNGRRFSKTSSYPPCHRYAFNFFYPYFLMMSSSPLF